jgi:hypothetical protein
MWKEFYSPYGSCLTKIQKEGLMSFEDILFLRRFKDRIRNLYQHSDEAKILEGFSVLVWSIPFGNVNNIIQSIENVKSRINKPTYMPASTPEISSIIKQTFDRRQAIGLLMMSMIF